MAYEVYKNGDGLGRERLIVWDGVGSLPTTHKGAAIDADMPAVDSSNPGDRYVFDGTQWKQTSFGGAVGVVSKSEVPVSSVGFGEGAVLAISTTDNANTEGAVIETQGKALHVWTTNACQINIGDSVVADDNDYVLAPNVLYKFPVQSGWRVSVRAIGTSGGSVYYHPVGE